MISLNVVAAFSHSTKQVELQIPSQIRPNENRYEVTSMTARHSSELETNIDAVLAAAHSVFNSQTKHSICDILVNSQPFVEFIEPQYGFVDPADYFDVTLLIASNLYSRVAQSIVSATKEIADVFNEVHQHDHEHISRVRIKINPRTISDWRKLSGLLVDGQMNYTQSEADALWGKGLRIFVSHASEQKEEASCTGEYLEKRGTSVFVAHEDIHPIEEWPREIEKALNTMDGFVALLTEDFKVSDWCGQELGFAVARDVPIFPLRVGADPYGFIYNIQALGPDDRLLRQEIDRKLAHNPRMKVTRAVWFEIFVKDVRESTSFHQSIRLSERLAEFDGVTVEQGDTLAETVNNNIEARGSFGFNSQIEENGKTNVAEHLTRMTGSEYVLNQDRTKRHEWLVRRKSLLVVTGANEQDTDSEDDDLTDLPW